MKKQTDEFMETEIYLEQQKKKKKKRNFQRCPSLRE
jgi:hypothetical protein